MKIIAFLVMLMAANLFAQDGLISHGNFFGSNLGGRQPTPEETAAAQQAEQARQLKAKSDALGGHVFRRVDGKIYNLWLTGQFIVGVVVSTKNNMLIMRGKGGSQTRGYFAVKNYTGNDVTFAKAMTMFAMDNGTYNWQAQTIKLYDCGEILSPDEENQQEQAVHEKAAQIQKAKTEAERQKVFLVQSNAVLHLQTMATNGEAWAQCSLGKHYLNGQGCETNRELAVKWLKMAAGNGDMEASNALVTLKP